MSKRGDTHPAPSDRPSPNALRSLLASRGGFTIDWHAGRAIDDGVAVCAYPAAAFVFDFEDWCDHAVGHWLQRIEPSLGGGVHLGGWLDGHRRCWLDLVRVFRSELVGRALDLGRSLDQQAAFDLSRRSLIQLRDRTDPEMHLGAPGRPVPVAIGSS